MNGPRLLDGRLKLRHLVLVDALSEHGSMVGAAAHLRVTQPVLTRALQDLEGILGVSLYERGSRGMTPTIYGAAFTDHARAVLGELTQAGRHVAELAEAALGTVTVGTHLAGSNVLLPKAIARLKATRPRLTVVIHEAMPDALLADLEAGRVDLIIGRIAGPASRSTVQEQLYDEPVRLIARTDHPAHELGRPRLRDLVEYPWVLPGAETALRGELDRLFHRHELVLPENRVECTSILTLRNLLLQTDMLAVLPALVAADEPRLRPLSVPLEGISHTVGLTLPLNRTPRPSVAALVDTLHEVADEMAV